MHKYIYTKTKKRKKKCETCEVATLSSSQAGSTNSRIQKGGSAREIYLLILALTRKFSRTYI